MSSERILLVGFDAPEAKDLRGRLPFECVCHEMLPRIVVERGRLFAESPRGGRYLSVSRVVFHGIFEHDLEFLAGLALWGGPCFPNPAAMMDCRLRLPCLVRALGHTRFGGPRGYASSGAEYEAEGDAVAKRATGTAARTRSGSPAPGGHRSQLCSSHTSRARPCGSSSSATAPDRSA
jgi:hypothetical protein